MGSKAQSYIDSGLLYSLALEKLSLYKIEDLEYKYKYKKILKNKAWVDKKRLKNLFL